MGNAGCKKHYKTIPFNSEKLVKRNIKNNKTNIKISGAKYMDKKSPEMKAHN